MSWRRRGLPSTAHCVLRVCDFVENVLSVTAVAMSWQDLKVTGWDRAGVHVCMWMYVCVCTRAYVSAECQFIVSVETSYVSLRNPFSHSQVPWTVSGTEQAPQHSYWVHGAWLCAKSGSLQPSQRTYFWRSDCCVFNASTYISSDESRFLFPPLLI